MVPTLPRSTSKMPVAASKGAGARDMYLLLSPGFALRLAAWVFGLSAALIAASLHGPTRMAAERAYMFVHLWMLGYAHEWAWWGLMVR